MPSSLGPAEILVILVVALIVLGPKRLPEAGRQVGKALSEVRRWSQDVRYEMTQAFEAEKAPPPMPPMTTSPPADATTPAETMAPEAATPSPEASTPVPDGAADPATPETEVPTEPFLDPAEPSPPRPTAT